MIAVSVILIIIAFLSLLFDTGILKSYPNIFPIVIDILLFVFSLIVLVRSVILYRIGEKEMLSKKVRDLEAKIDLLTKKDRERMKFGESKEMRGNNNGKEDGDFN